MIGESHGSIPTLEHSSASLSPFVNTLLVPGVDQIHDADGELHVEGGLVREDLHQKKPCHLLQGRRRRCRPDPTAFCGQGEKGLLISWMILDNFTLCLP